MRLLTLLLLVSISIVPLRFSYAQTAKSIDSSIEVVDGQELLIYSKSKAHILSLQSQALSGSANIKVLNTKLAVASLSKQAVKRGGSIKRASFDDLTAACEKIRNSMLGCEINQVVRLSATPNDSSWKSLYGLRKISAQRAWDYSTGSHSVKVAVVDTGVDYTHSDLVSNIAINSAEIPSNGIDDDANGYVDDYYGYDFTSDSPDSYDDNGHGTHVAGTIGAAGNNSIGVAGVNWKVGIVPVKVLNASGSGTTASVIMGINYALARGAKIINLSLGSKGYSEIFYDAISNANSAGALIVAAAGNSAENNDSTPTYPASFNLPNIISVAATDSADLLASFSNYGVNTVHIAAPGLNIRSTVPGNGYSSYSGTSMATPHIAGAVALLKAYSPESTLLQIKSAILNNGDILSGLGSKVATSARLNLANALAALSNGLVPPVPSPTPGEEEDGDSGEDDGEGDDGSGSLPGDGVDNPDEDLENYPIDYIGVLQRIVKNKAKVTIFLLDAEDYAIPEASIKLICDNKVIGEKLSNDDGEVKFSVKIKKSKSKCSVVASNQINSLTKVFSLKPAQLRRKSARR